MKLTLIQTELFWENKENNISHFDKLIDNVNEQTDVFVLPEMFATGFTMRANEFAEQMDGPVVEWMKEKAIKKNAAVCGSLIIEHEGKFYNRFVWAGGNGVVYSYDKRHLFRMGEENDHYTKGKSRIIIEHKGVNIFPVVCYDLRFPVWLKRTKEFDYDLLLVVANWPERRTLAWKTLLQARAIENQCYVAAVNRIGNDGNGMYHSGDSSFIDHKGEIVFQKSDEHFIKTFTVNLKELEEWRKSFPVIEDADNFTIE